MVGSTEVPVELFEAKVRSWRQPSLLTGTTPIQTQFQVYAYFIPMFVCMTLSKCLLLYSYLIW